MDGWSSPQNEPVIGVSITAKSNTYLIDTIDTSGQPHTKEFMTKTAVDAIKNAASHFRVKVQHVVSDIASNMSGMRHILNETLGADIITYQCQAHLLNLLAKDMKHENNETITKVISVLKFLRNRHAASAKLKEENLQRPPIPTETR